VQNIRPDLSVSSASVDKFDTLDLRAPSPGPEIENGSVAHSFLRAAHG
jgi:hypothetical protein